MSAVPSDPWTTGQPAGMADFRTAPQGEPQLTSVEEFLNWGKEHSLFYLLFATACCGIELMQTGGPRHDVDRMGMIPRATPRQSDLMIVAGTITHKMASRVKTLYQQMTEPRWVVSMGSCANAGGPFSKYSYSVLNGVDKYIPVDVYIPGCPPRPEALIDGIMVLRERVRRYRTLGVRDRDPYWVPGADCAVPTVQPAPASPISSAATSAPAESAS